MAVKIRRLHEADREALSSFMAQSYDEYPNAMWFDSKPQYRDLTRIFMNKLNGMQLNILEDFVADDEGRIVGDCEIVKTGSNAGLVGIIVRKGYSGKGIGRNLLEEASKGAAGIGIERLRVEVMEGNDHSQKFFEACGFLVTGHERTERNGKACDVAVLEKALT